MMRVDDPVGSDEKDRTAAEPLLQGPARVSEVAILDQDRVVEIEGEPR
jgi:hypothetical protein